MASKADSLKIKALELQGHDVKARQNMDSDKVFLLTCASKLLWPVCNSRTLFFQKSASESLILRCKHL